MKDITEILDNELKKMWRNAWEKIYVLVDCHGTIFKPSYSLTNEKFEFYPFAKEALQKLSNKIQKV